VVHNAASGYWAIAAGARAPSTAVSGHGASFAAGLLEAACQCVADARPVLLAGFDTDARGALASVNRSRGLLGVALVLSPQRSVRSQWSLDWTSASGPHAAAAPTTLAAMADNAMADALPLFEVLGNAQAAHVTLPLATNLALALALQPL
jgi:Beta-ketoacyl synthase, N-terminal domain